MKIEMGESLFYSWLRHVKDCQIVQTNWTTSNQWLLQHQDELTTVMKETSDYFSKKYGYSIYKRTSSLSQLLQQAECDAIGISVSGNNRKVFAVVWISICFLQNGLRLIKRDFNFSGSSQRLTQLPHKQNCLRPWCWRKKKNRESNLTIKSFRFILWLFHRIFYHLKMSKCSLDGLFFFRRALMDSGIFRFSLIVAFPLDQTVLGLDLGNIQTGNL